MGLCDLRHLFRTSLSDDVTACLASLRSEVDHPIGCFDDIQIVFDDDEGIAGIHQFVQDGQQFLDVVEVKAGGRLIQDIEQIVRRRIFQLGGDLQPLRFPSGQGRGGWPSVR